MLSTISSGIYTIPEGMTPVSVSGTITATVDSGQNKNCQYQLQTTTAETGTWTTHILGNGIGVGSFKIGEDRTGSANIPETALSEQTRRIKVDFKGETSQFRNFNATITLTIKGEIEGVTVVNELTLVYHEGDIVSITPELKPGYILSSGSPEVTGDTSAINGEIAVDRNTAATSFAIKESLDGNRTIDLHYTSEAMP